MSDNQSELRANNGNIIPKHELPPNPLSLLQEQEVIIQKGLMGLLVVGAALRKIKEDKLYKDNYSTYDEYCQQRWNFTPQHANRLIKAATVVEKIKNEPIGSVLPQSESQVRALLKSKNPATDWKKIQEVTGKEQPTAKEIETFISDQNKKDDVIDAEIVKETHEKVPREANSAAPEETEQGSIVLLLKNIIRTPYKKGVRTGRAQISVEADDDSVERLERLKKSLHSSKSSVVSLALIFLEQSLETVSDTSLANN